MSIFLLDSSVVQASGEAFLRALENDNQLRELVDVIALHYEQSIKELMKCK